MIYRLVLAVAVMTALLGATAPALSTARADAANSAVERQLDDLAAELDRLVAADDATPNGDARRVVELRLPPRTYTNAGVDHLRFETRAGVGLATWQVESRTRTKRLVGVPVRTTDSTQRLEEPGTHRLVFALTRSDGRRVLTVHRFKSEAAARSGYA